MTVKTDIHLISLLRTELYRNGFSSDAREDFVSFTNGIIGA